MSFNKLIKNSILCHLPFLRYFGRHKHSFARLLNVFPGCHGNQVPFLMFLMFLQLTMIQVLCPSTFHELKRVFKFRGIQPLKNPKYYQESIVLEIFLIGPQIIVSAHVPVEITKPHKVGLRYAIFFSFQSLQLTKHIHYYQYLYISRCYASIFTIIEKLIDFNFVNDMYLRFLLLR